MENLNLRICFLCLLLAGPGAAQNFFEVPIDMPLPVSTGVACGDYDNDQWPDIFLTGSTNPQPPDPAILLGNQGKGRFADRTALIEPYLFPNTDTGAGVIFGDYDNDNDLDLYVPRGFIFSSARDRLLRNDQGRFTDVSLAAGLTDSLPSGNAIWLDYDRDGWLDLYVGHWDLNYDAPDLYNTLYRNRGDGTFAEVTEAAGLKMNLYPPGTVRHGGSDGGMAAGDFNDDGWPDLYLGVSEAPNRLFLNDGQGHFLDATTKEIGDEGQALGVAVGDIDNDGDLDIFQAAGGLGGSFRSLMLMNVGQGQFLDVTEGVGLTGLGAQDTFGASLADIDNDGDLDLLIATPTTLFLNNGDRTFIDATSRSGLSNIGGNLAFLDYDLDGFLDLMSRIGVVRGVAPKGVFHNQGNGNHWLRVELVGTRSNRNGIGARLFATSGALRQMREVLGGMGNDQDEMGAHFGLGERTLVDRLEVRWPSGQVDVLTDIPADQEVRVFEGSTQYHHVEPTRWQQAPPETLVAGIVFHLDLAVQPVLFEPEARITRVTVDLSSLGGDAEIALAAEGDGTYHLRDFPITAPNGVHTLHMLIDQTTSLGSYWTRLSRQVTVVPAGDLVVFDEALSPGWQEEHHRTVEIADLAQSGEVHAGRVAGMFQARGSFSGWNITFRAAVPVEPFGYTLRFAIRPGEMTLPGNARFTVSLLPGKGVNLLDSARVNLYRKEWQVVEIPMEAFERESPIESIIFSGNFAGTFYLDDIRLVAATPSSVTVVAEDRTTALPQSFSLSQNFPNPFNSETVIRFALPESGEMELAVYNLVGQRVVRLAEGAREAGAYTVRWDGRDARGSELASGVYLYRLWVGEKVETRKLLLLQ